MRKKKAIKRILKEFDFEKVHITMKSLNWTYFWTNGKAPSIKQLKETAEGLLKDVAYNKSISFDTISSGGFQASYINGILELKFVLTYDYQVVKKKKNR